MSQTGCLARANAGTLLDTRPARSKWTNNGAHRNMEPKDYMGQDQLSQALATANTRWQHCLGWPQDYS